MFMSSNNDQDIETLFGKKKKGSKKPLKSVTKVLKNVEKKAPKAVKPKGKSKPKDMVDVEVKLLGLTKLRAKRGNEKAKVSKAKQTKASPKKALKLKKIKPKAYKVSGSFTLDSEGKVLKKTKSINIVDGNLTVKNEIGGTLAVKNEIGKDILVYFRVKK